MLNHLMAAYQRGNNTQEDNHCQKYHWTK